MSWILDDHFGLNGGMAGFERLYKDGSMAIFHGCGYENPSYSHFTSMAYWHTPPQTAEMNMDGLAAWLGK